MEGSVELDASRPPTEEPLVNTDRITAEMLRRRGKDGAVRCWGINTDLHWKIKNL